MYRIIALGIFVAMAVEAADPLWRSLGNCLTPQDTPCRTIKWELTGWENMSWGFHAIRRWNGSAVLAYSQSGAFMERYSQKFYRNWVFPSNQWDLMAIKFPIEQRTIEIDHSTKTYHVHSGVYGGLTVWDSKDTDCARKASAFGLSGLTREGESTMAGFASIQYSGQGPNHERVYMRLAPSLGCTQMIVITLAHNILGLPTAYYRSQVTVVHIGEPDKELFEVPKGYGQIH